jgi:predicted nucleic acid-binding protein
LLSRWLRGTAIRSTAGRRNLARRCARGSPGGRRIEAVDLDAIDCNVLAYLLIDGDQTPRALLGRDADWHSEALLLIELSNVLATAMRAKRMSMNDATAVLTQAHGIVEPGLHRAHHLEALGLAVQYRVSACDARYLIVARDLGAKLVTEDAKLRSAAPKLTQSLADAVGY